MSVLYRSDPQFEEKLAQANAKKESVVVRDDRQPIRVVVLCDTYIQYQYFLGLYASFNDLRPDRISYAYNQEQIRERDPWRTIYVGTGTFKSLQQWDLDKRVVHQLRVHSAPRYHYLHLPT